jgi:hypothetical protein
MLPAQREEQRDGGRGDRREQRDVGGEDDDALLRRHRGEELDHLASREALEEHLDLEWRERERNADGGQRHREAAPLDTPRSGEGTWNGQRNFAGEHRGVPVRGGRAR